MLELEGCGRPIAGTGQDGKGNKGSITTLYFGRGRHHGDDVSDLLQRRHSLVPVGLGDSGLFGRQIEVFGIGVRNSGPVPWLSGQPDEEPFQSA
jgi:hypothetical protein